MSITPREPLARTVMLSRPATWFSAPDKRPLDLGRMEIVDTDIGEQTERALKNIEIVLNGLGLSLQNAVKTPVYLKDMNDFLGLNQAYARMFHPHRHAQPRRFPKS
jgi:enamine deaminase RidA (YjgF/YER057c/UK114 family)